MRIYYRVCEKQETLSFVERWQNQNKIDIIKKCWLSVQSSVDPKNDNFIVIEDGCSKELLDWMVQTCKTSDIVIDKVGDNIKEGDPKEEFAAYKRLVELTDYWTAKEPNDLHYWCADDYLHLPLALHVMKSSYTDGWRGYVVPQDYPDRYTLDFIKTCVLYAGSMSHWRTIPSCTGNTCAPGSVWRRHMTIMKQNAVYNQDSFLWEAYGKSGAVSAIPGQATHLAENCMTPTINWQLLWDGINIEIDFDAKNTNGNK